MITKELLASMIETADADRKAKIVGRACLVLFKNQTRDEQVQNTTNEENSIGFTSADAQCGSITAKTFIKYGTLQEWQVERWLKVDRRGTMRIVKYWKQLDQAARAKAA